MRKRKGIVLILIALLLFTMTGCKGKKGDDIPVNPDGSQTTDGYQADMSPEGIAWRKQVTESPVIAEVEYKGTVYTVHAMDSLRYIYNTATTEIITGAPVTYTKGAVLKDWVSPYGSAGLQEKEALFDTTWEYTSTRARALIGYCNEAYNLVTRARTSEYIEYIYKDKTDDTHYRIAITDDYILFAPLLFSYVFDVTTY